MAETRVTQSREKARALRLITDTCSRLYDREQQSRSSEPCRPYPATQSGCSRFASLLPSAHSRFAAPFRSRFSATHPPPSLTKHTPITRQVPHHVHHT